MIEINEMIELILVILQIFLLLGLFKIYYTSYKKVKVPFTIGLLLFASILIMENIFSILAILTSITPFLPIIENAISLVGIVVFLYISLK